MPSKFLLAILVTVFIVGCSNTGVVPMGSDTFMVSYQGSTLQTKANLEAKCLRDANTFCAQKGLVMVPISSTGRNGLPVPFGKGGTCDLIFKAVPPNSPLAASPPPMTRALDD